MALATTILAFPATAAAVECSIPTFEEAMYANNGSFNNQPDARIRSPNRVGRSASFQGQK
jgi:hypothetical protein